MKNDSSILKKEGNKWLGYMFCFMPQEREVLLAWPAPTPESPISYFPVLKSAFSGVTKRKEAPQRIQSNDSFVALSSSYGKSW